MAVPGTIPYNLEMEGSVFFIFAVVICLLATTASSKYKLMYIYTSTKLLPLNINGVPFQKMACTGRWALFLNIVKSYRFRSFKWNTDVSWHYVNSDKTIRHGHSRIILKSLVRNTTNTSSNFISSDLTRFFLFIK